MRQTLSDKKEMFESDKNCVKATAENDKTDSQHKFCFI